MNIIIERDLRTEYRKKKKEEWDKLIDLYTDIDGEKDDTVRLLDDGIVVDGNAAPRFYIRKGAVKRFYEKLSDDFVGYITLAHLPLSKFPFSLGEWRKRDLTLVDKGNGFYALDVDLHLDEDSVFVKELRRMKYTAGVSVEMQTSEDKKLSKKIRIPVVDKLSIAGFSVVGNAGNVNSSGINFGGAEMTMKDLAAAIDSVDQPNLDEVNKKLDALLEAEETVETEEPAAEKAEEPVEESAKVEEFAEEPEAEPVEEEAEEAAEEPAEEEAEEEAALSAITVVMENLAKENAELKAQNEKLTAKLAARDKAEQDFLARFKKLSVSVSSTERVTMEEAEAPMVQNVFTDGIGEI